jgi:hypothetical protein
MLYYDAQPTKYQEKQPIYVKINEPGLLISPLNCSINVKENGGCGQAPVKLWK